MKNKPLILRKQGKWMAGGCTHGDLLNEDAFEQFLAFKKTYKPNVMLHLGDAFELTALRKSATSEEKEIQFENDIASGLWAMSEMFKGVEDTFFLRGNHCERLWSLRDKGSAVNAQLAERHISEIEDWLGYWGTTMLPYCSHKGTMRINDILFMHGYRHGLHAAKDLGKDYHGNIVFVHTHRIEEAYVTGWPDALCVINAGCLRELLPEFASRGTSTLSWGHGFAYGEFFADGSSSMHLEKISV